MKENTVKQAYGLQRTLKICDSFFCAKINRIPLLTNYSTTKSSSSKSNVKSDALLSSNVTRWIFFKVVMPCSEVNRSGLIDFCDFHAPLSRKSSESCQKVSQTLIRVKKFPSSLTNYPILPILSSSVVGYPGCFTPTASVDIEGTVLKTS